MSNAEHDQFEEEVSNAGLAPYHYHGRAMWHGPAVSVDDIQDAIRATSVKVQWDSLGRRYVVYPIASDRSDYFTCTIEDGEEDEE